MTDEVVLRRAFDDLMGTWDAPLLVVTVAHGDRVGGCLVGFHTQVSIRPHRYLVAMSPRNRTARLVAAATHVAVHVIPRDRRDIAERFGGHSGDDLDKFDGVGWRPGPGRAPVLADASAWFAGRIAEFLCILTRGTICGSTSRRAYKALLPYSPNPSV